MHYIYSTSTCSTVYCEYATNNNKDIAQIAKDKDNKPLKVLIKGGANAADKHFVTPKGVVTIVSDQEMEMLLRNEKFKRHVASGFMSFEKKQLDIDAVVANMQSKDKSAPLTKDDFILTDSSTDEQKVYKRKDAIKAA